MEKHTEITQEEIDGLLDKLVVFGSDATGDNVEVKTSVKVGCFNEANQIAKMLDLETQGIPAKKDGQDYMKLLMKGAPCSHGNHLAAVSILKIKIERIIEKVIDEPCQFCESLKILIQYIEFIDDHDNELAYYMVRCEKGCSVERSEQMNSLLEEFMAEYELPHGNLL